MRQKASHCGLLMLLMMPSSGLQAAEDLGKIPSWQGEQGNETEVVYERGSYLKGYSGPLALSAEMSKLKMEDRFYVSLNKILIAYEQESGGHIRYMDITDAEYDELISYMRVFIADKSAETNRKSELVCKDYGLTENSNYDSISLQMLQGEYNRNQKSISSVDTELVTSFYEKVRSRMGEDVYKQFTRYIEVYGHSSSISFSKGFDFGSLSIAQTEQFFKRLCQ